MVISSLLGCGNVLFVRLFFMAGLAMFLGSVLPESSFVSFVSACCNNIASVYLWFIKMWVPLMIVSFMAYFMLDLGGQSSWNTVLGVCGFALCCMLCGSMIVYGIINVFIWLYPWVFNIAFDTTKLASSSVDQIRYSGVSVESLFVIAMCTGWCGTRVQLPTIKKLLGEVCSILTNVFDILINICLPFYIFSVVFVVTTSFGSILSGATLLSLFKVSLLSMFMQMLYITLLSVVALLATDVPFMSLVKTVMPAYLGGLCTQSSSALLPVNLSFLNNTLQSGTTMTSAAISICNVVHKGGTLVSLIVAILVFYYMVTQRHLDFFVFLPSVLIIVVLLAASPGVPGGSAMVTMHIISGYLHTLDSSFDFGAIFAVLVTVGVLNDAFSTAVNFSGDLPMSLCAGKFLDKKRL